MSCYERIFHLKKRCSYLPLISKHISKQNRRTTFRRCSAFYCKIVLDNVDISKHDAEEICAPSDVKHSTPGFPFRLMVRSVLLAKFADRSQTCSYERINLLLSATLSLLRTEWNSSFIQTVAHKTILISLYCTCIRPTIRHYMQLHDNRLKCHKTTNFIVFKTRSDKPK